MIDCKIAEVFFMAKGFSPGDTVARIDDTERVELVKVAKGNSRRVISYLVPGRTRPIAADPDFGEFVTIAEFPKAAARLYDKGSREFVGIFEARRAIMDEADADTEGK
jgi:hypothetical protein